MQSKIVKRMATINRPKRNYVSYSQKSEISQQAYRLVYNTKRWRRLREALLMINPICQRCGQELSVEVHHVIPLADARDEQMMVDIGFDESNLMCLCERCHDIIHREVKGGKRGRK